MDRHLEDLLWLIQAPGLLEAPFQSVPDGSLKVPGDDLLQGSLPELVRRLAEAPRSYKLGIYAECLLEHALRLEQPCRLLASHLSVYRPLPEGRLNTGEFDFLLRSEQLGDVDHWELAVKFFLLRVERPGEREITPDDFVGPNGRDSLGNKLRKLVGRQLHLGETPEGREALVGEGLLAPAGRVHARLLSRGRLFYPWRRQREEFLLPFISMRSLQGWWVRQPDLEAMLSARSSADSRYAILRRPLWLAPVDERTDALEFFSAARLSKALQLKFASDPGAVLLAEVRGGKEVSRGFVVHPGWPTPVDAPGA